MARRLQGTRQEDTMLELLLACGNELVEARATPSAWSVWWTMSRETTQGLVLGLGAPAAAATGVSIYRWAGATTGLRRLLVLAVGAGVGLALGLTAVFASKLPPLALAPPAAPLLLALLRALTARVGRRRDARVEAYPPVQAAAACSA